MGRMTLEENQVLGEVKPKDSIVDYFNEKAKENPKGIAIRFKEKSITFEQLNKKANQLAQCLRKNGVKEEFIVPIVIQPSIDIIIGILGILKAGGAYLPIDPEFPRDRISYILQDSSAEIIISRTKESKKLPSRGAFNIILLGEGSTLYSNESQLSQLPLPKGRDLAYVCYTSGSTGNPKGVMIEHRQLLSYLLNVFEKLELEECQSFAILGTFSADAGYTALFAALGFGKTLHIIDLKHASSFQDLVSYFESFRIDCYKITPTLMAFFLEFEEVDKILPQKTLILGGEASSWNLIQKLTEMFPEGGKFFNHYGPTETTIGVVAHKFRRKALVTSSLVPIGKPFKGTALHILDPNHTSVPRGQSGELYVSGQLVARGYLNQSDLTSQRFIFLNLPGGKARVYKTGDLVKYSAEGNLEYLGRIDSQVKIRGNRVELTEIEAMILQSGTVKQCLVLARSHQEQSKFLVGYIIPEKSFQQGQLTNYLKQKLPSYMIPSYWVKLEAWPKTFNNKVDREALPNPKVDEEFRDTGSYVPNLQSDIKIQLINVWKKVLMREKVEMEDNFFDLGGDSLLLVKLAFEIKKQVGINVSAADLFEFNTIKKIIENQNKGNWHRGVSIRSKGGQLNVFEVSDEQRNLFIQNKLNPSVAFPHASVTFRIEGDLDLPKLEASLQKIIERNESLKTSFFLSEGKVFGQIHPNYSFKLTLFHDSHSLLEEALASLTQAFDFSKPPLIRACVLMLKDQQYFHLDLPHIISDGESLKIIMQDLCRDYNSHAYEGDHTFQYSHHLQRLASYLDSNRFREDEVYWKSQLAKVGPSNTKLRFDNSTETSKFEGMCLVEKITEKILQDSYSFIKQNKITLFQFLLSAYFLLIYKALSLRNFAVMVPVHNRNQQEQERIVGLLSNVVLFKVEINENLSIEEFLATNKKVILSALAHQQYPFEKVLKLWSGQGRKSKELTQFFFGFHNHPGFYSFGNSMLKLILPMRHKENLRLSLAAFQTPDKLDLRVSSCMGYFNRAELERLINSYTHILALLSSSKANSSLSSVIKNQILF